MFKMRKINFNWSNKVGIGVMTGTSCDGIDISAVQFSGNELNEFNVLASQKFPYPNSVKKFVQKVNEEMIAIAEISQFNFYISEIYYQFISNFINEYLKFKPDFVSVHGQTIWHNPNPSEFLTERVSSTYQAVNLSALAKKLRLPVVGDFRSGDIALGGQGAPLVPIFDYHVFRSEKRGRICVNIGGIANVTILPKKCGKNDVIAFDSGPGNSLIDAYALEQFGEPYDDGGNLAKSGVFNKELFYNIVELDEYQRMSPPKSTGKDYYNLNFIWDALEMLPYKVNQYDVLNTLTHYTSYTLANSIKNYADSSYEVILSGGGTHNQYLLDCLAKYLRGYEINTSDAYGIVPEFKEAIAFAFLGYLFLKEDYANLPSSTGASEETILGTLSL